LADNVGIATGTDKTIATDDIGGVHYERVKLNIGADGAAADVQPPDADGIASSRVLPAGGMLWNGSGWDRERGPEEATLLASASRTESTVSATQTNRGHRGLFVTIEITGGSGFQVECRIVGSIGGSKYTVLASVPGVGTYLTAQGTHTCEIGPGVSGDEGTSGNLVDQRVSTQLPRTWNVQVVHGNATAATYSVVCSLIP
jgi:hypothetical protein